ncbi:MAG: cytochrome c3 family protein [candidate division KSB1 bacterium]|nr:cytochrome c3 family protein [candidate division KSB1 bacterium]MDQ7063955.1 cytochrome c3 family protein [candidate division KSB1 bacterium]
MKIIHRSICVCIAFAVLLIFGWRASAQEGQSWKDPVSQWAKTSRFSHKLHITEAEVECSACHPMAEDSQSAEDFLLPTMDECSECHDVEDEDECATCHGEEEEIETFDQPVRTITFNHKIHIARELSCETCHKGLEESEAPTTATLPSMMTCIGCHDGSAAPPACQTCHANPENLRPASHKQVDWYKEHKRQVRTTSPESTCSACHTENDCQTCHAEASLQMTKGLFLRPLSEDRILSFGTKVMVKQTFHDLNYRFIHAIDFRSKRADCFSCHNQQTFCTDCHEKNQEAGFRSPVPLTHRSPDFVRIGVGSGGGLHATLGKRDIETCAACHDLEGADPVCITCHVDRTPGKGNDPKTHPSGFRNDEGDWHHDSASLCFQCHTNTQKAGLGFCGYCHGAK